MSYFNPKDWSYSALEWEREYDEKEREREMLEQDDEDYREPEVTDEDLESLKVIHALVNAWIKVGEKEFSLSEEEIKKKIHEICACTNRDPEFFFTLWNEETNVSIYEFLEAKRDTFSPEIQKKIDFLLDYYDWDDWRVPVI